jgi:hypothetical protein
VDKHLEQHQRQVLLAFGPSAQIGGTLGTSRGPGELRITVDDRLLGDGETFQEALESLPNFRGVACGCTYNRRLYKTAVFGNQT